MRNWLCCHIQLASIKIFVKYILCTHQDGGGGGVVCEVDCKVSDWLDETSRSIVLHLPLTTQAIVGKPRIFLVVISYWSTGALAFKDVGSSRSLVYSLGQNFNLFIPARLPSAWTSVLKR